MTQEQGPLAGVRVVDFTWAAMGPYAGYLLASLGAEVIQVSRPNKDPTSTTTAITKFFDVGKICVNINVKHHQGKKILLDLIGKSDIFLENFRPGVIEDLGFDYETVSRNNRNLVMVSGSALGRGGVDSSYVGYAPVFGALSGLADVTGFADGPPTEIRYPCDLTSGAVMALAAIAGLAGVKAGKGSYVDLAARDALLWTLTSAFALEEERSSRRCGNEHDAAFPHGVYRCAGEDQWISIAASSDVQRRSLCRLIGWSTAEGAAISDLSEQEKMSLESAVGGWVLEKSAQQAVTELQALGVPAFPSYDARDIWDDQHLRSRNFFQYSEAAGWVAAAPWCLAGDRKHRLAMQGSSSDRARVFNGILGMALDEIEVLRQGGVLG